MTIYNVHIYREMRLVFGGIEADTPEAAATIARDKPTEEADSIDDCDGETLAALVDLLGDEEYERSEMIDFEAERERKAAAALLAACRMVVDRWERGDLAEAARACSAAIAEAEACGVPPVETAAVPPIVTITVQGGLIEDMDATIPVDVVVEDWDITDYDTGKKPARSVWKLTGGLSGPKAEKLRGLVAND